MPVSPSHYEAHPQIRNASVIVKMDKLDQNLPNYPLVWGQQPNLLSLTLHYMTPTQIIQQHELPVWLFVHIEVAEATFLCPFVKHGVGWIILVLL